MALPPAEPNTVAEAVAALARRLSQAGIESAHREAQILLRAATGLSREALLAHPETPLTEEARVTLAEHAARRVAREPLPYITGEVEFYSLPFHVTPAALVPRPETEILVEAVLTRLPPTAKLLLDIGAGSGVIAVVLARERPDAMVVAVDVSRPALALTRRNARRHGVVGRMRLVQSDLLTGLRGRADAIVANLPYIDPEELEGLQPEVRDYEPRRALEGGYHGLAVIERLCAALPSSLAPGGLAALEVGAGQAPAVAAKLEAAGLARIEIVPDYAGIERVVLGFGKDDAEAGGG